MTLGQRLKEARKNKGLTQTELGRLLGLSDATINRYEKDLRSPDPRTLKKLAGLLEISVDYLLNHEQQEIDELSQSWPEGVKALRRAHSQMTPAERRGLLKIINAMVRESEIEAEQSKK